jgi:mannose-6-phosphate isomerase
MVWGGRHLNKVLGKTLPSAEPYGESWEISDHGSHRSVVAGGELGGSSLRELMDRDPAALLGSPLARASGSSGGGTGETFPWLVKYLDARDWLSVQVHPDDRAVGRLWPGEGGKTEAWFVLAADPGSRVYAGLLPGVDAAALRQALAAGTVADCLHGFEPSPGDCLFLPAGTVHAVGGGVLLAEVQQTSDATFRLFDWNRRDAQGRTRPLHVEQALACIDWTAGPVQPVRAAGYPRPGQQDQARSVWQALVRCSYFHLDYVRRQDPFAIGGNGRMQALLVLHGRASLGWRNRQEDLVAGDTVLLPAASYAVLVCPDGPLGLLVTSLPQACRAAA